MKDRSTQLYRAFDHYDRLLYVGISFGALGRLDQHRSGSRWWAQVRRIEVEHYATRQEAKAAETAAIKTERPVYNVMEDERSQGERVLDQSFWGLLRTLEPELANLERLVWEESITEDSLHITLKHILGVRRWMLARGPFTDDPITINDNLDGHFDEMEAWLDETMVPREELLSQTSTLQFARDYLEGIAVMLVKRRLDHEAQWGPNEPPEPDVWDNGGFP